MDWADTGKLLAENVGAAFTAADQAIKTVKSLKDLFKVEDKSPAAREAREKLVELQDQLTTMREQASTLKAALADLKEQLADRENFLAEAKNYILTETAPNSLAYVLKSPATEAEKAIRLCTPCFEDKRRSIMQFEKQDWHFDTLRCPRCESTIRVPNDIKPAIMTVHRERSLW